jgi:hypothetical protein
MLRAESGALGAEKWQTMAADPARASASLRSARGEPAGLQCATGAFSKQTARQGFTNLTTHTELNMYQSSDIETLT